MINAFAFRQEAFYIKMTSYVRGVILSFLMFTSRFGIFITMLLYMGYTTHITVESVFFLTCYYNIMKQTMTLYFPQAVGQVPVFISNSDSESNQIRAKTGRDIY